MKVTVIESGGGLPTSKRACASIVVDGRLLFDIGLGALAKLASSGLMTESLSDLFVSHWHRDHVGDIIPLLWAFDLTGRRSPFRVHGPPGFDRVYRNMIARVDAAGEWAPPFSLTVDEVRFGSKVGEVAVCSAAHRVPTLALRADISGKSVCYSSDTRHSTNVVELAKNVDVLIHEASYLQHQAFIALISGHSTARAAGKVAALAGARKLVLTHIPPRNDGKTSEYLEEAGMEYSGEIIVAEDMVTVDV